MVIWIVVKVKIIGVGKVLKGIADNPIRSRNREDGYSLPVKMVLEHPQ